LGRKERIEMGLGELLRRYTRVRKPFHTYGIPSMLETHLEESHGVAVRRAPSDTDPNAWMYEQHCAKHHHPVDPAQRDAYASWVAGIRGHGSSSAA
jgi:hypothetical protein